MTSPTTESADSVVLPLRHETISVSRRRVETGTVRVSTVTQRHDALIDETLTHQRVEIVRVPVGRTVETMPDIREEGDVTIIPIVEEVVVVQKHLVLKEEVHIRRVQVTEQHCETVVLREQQAVITRHPAGVENDSAMTPPEHT